MGYAVYEDTNHRRWAGYGVPAECDYPTCDQKIDRGMSYRCEQGDPCGLFFCAMHENHATHEGIRPKPDSLEWERWILTDASWALWRDENSEQVAAMLARLEAAE